MIQNAAKAVILQKDMVLMEKCMDGDGIVYYELPGGYQRDFETMEDAVVRECLEETGYTVAVDRFLALQEEIMMNPTVREAYPRHAHRIFHVFLCHLTGDEGPVAPTEKDPFQIGIEWVPLDALPRTVVRPKIIHEKLVELLASGEIGYMKANRLNTFFYE